MYGGFEDLGSVNGAKRLFRTLGVAGGFALTEIEIKKLGSSYVTEFVFSNEQNQYVKKAISHDNNYKSYSLPTGIELERKSKRSQLLEIILAELPLAKEEASKITSASFEEYMMLMSTFLKRALSERENTVYNTYIAVITNKKGNFPEIPNRTGTINTSKDLVYIQEWEKLNRFNWIEEDKPQEEVKAPVKAKEEETDGLPF